MQYYKMANARTDLLHSARCKKSFVSDVRIPA